ncbi:MAG: Ig-like domain-containing protein [Meiothermus sp.]|uniref:tandem-95 repeat protein n=1 Tax=Meiothermus sp. TaxID=1955249 RepID=UPI00298F090F|nr:Ig-like domain-containing protein [Meiothermus sp.]MDW8425436.1 Ig-like domain-containing protein [Meiothermus sp.]
MISGSGTTTLSDAQNPSNNFFNSSISNLGTRFTAKNPDYVNQLGLDVDRISTTGLFPNNATSASVRFTTSGDVYFPHVLTTAIDIFVPNLTADFVKSVTDLNGGALLPGDVLEYTIGFSNTGQDGSINTIVRDPIPAGTTYQPGSLQILTGPNAGAKTDAAGDDQAEFDSANNRVVFRLGTGATASAGGAFAPGEGTTLRFRVVVNSGTFGQTISNVATINYNAQTLGTAFSDTAPATASTSVASLADLSVVKTGPSSVAVGAPISYSIAVSNAGPSAVSGATLTDTVPSNISGVTWSCSPASACSPASGSGNAISTSISLASGASLTLSISGTASTAGNITNTASVSLPSGFSDPNPGNNTSSQSTLIAQPVIDVIKSAGAPVQTGPTTFEVPISVVVGNTGSVPAPNVQVSENLSRTFSSGSPTISLVGSPALTVTPSSGATCTANSSFNGTSVFGLLAGTDDLAPGQSCTISFRVRLVYASSGAIPSAPQNNQVFASSRPDSAGATNPGHTFPGGTPTPPTGATATDTSSNTTHPAGPGGLPGTPNGDTPSATPITLSPNPGSISGTLYLDQNNNGAFDPASDTRLPNVSVELVNSGGSVVATTQSDSSGNYSFTGVAPGTYTVRVVTTDPDLGGAIPSAPASGTLGVTVNPGAASGNQNFGFGRRGLDVLKSAAPPTRVDARTFTVPIVVVAGNTGTLPLPNVQLTENLARTFAAGSPAITLVSAPVRTGGTAPCTINPSFNGTTDPRLLTGTDTFQGGQNCTIAFTVRVQYPDAASVPSSPQNNQVFASSTPSGPNPGHTFPGGTPTPPTGATATDTSSNAPHPAGPGSLPSTPNGDTPSATPITLTPVADPPVANPDTATTPFGTPVTLNPAANDTASPGASLVAGSIDLDPGTPGQQSSRTVPGQGRFDLNPSTGQVTFTPEPGFVGTAQIPYTIQDNLGQTSAPSTLTVNVTPPPAPVARDDAKAGDFNQPVLVPAVLNDTSSPGTTLVPGSIDLDPSTPAQETTRTIPGKGTFTVQPDGTVRFDPVPGFEGTAVVPYTIQDNLGQTSNPANISVTIRPRPAPPTARDDSATTPRGTPVTLNAAANDTANLPNVIDPASIDLDPSTPGQQTRFTVPGRGTFEAQPDGTVVFTPEPGFTGGVSIPYTIADRDNDPSTPPQTSNRANLSVTVTELPSAVDDRASTPVNTPVSLPVTANDATNPGQSIVPGTLDLDPDTPGQQTSRTLTGQGTFEAQPDGTVRFTPAPGFVGTVSTPYTVQDSAGVRTGPANIIVTVTPPAPSAANDTARTPFNTPVTLYPSTNDTAGAGGQLVPGSIDLDPSTPGQQTERVVPGQGRFVLQPATNLNNESVQFIPEPGFSGNVSIPYTIQDNFGQTSSPATLSVTVDPPSQPVANNDLASTRRDTPVTLNPAANDAPGLGTALDPRTIDLDPSTPGQQTRLELPGQGVFELQPDGRVIFTPAPGFTGTVQAPYTIQDQTGQTSNTARMVVTVNPLPAASNDSATTPFGTPVTLNPLGNDTPSDGATFDPSTLDLDPLTPGVQDSLTVPGKGTFQRNPDGSVTFTPAPGFTGTVTIPYTVRDSGGGTTNTANLSVTVQAPAVPTARDDSASTPFNTPVTLNPLANDSAGAGATLDPSTLDLDPATPGIQDRVSVPGKGTFQRNPDGSVTFTPAEGFTGTVEVPYTVRDNAGQESNPARLRVEVRSPSLLLEKIALQGVARVGGRLEYILKATNQDAGATMRQVTLSDLLPAGLLYQAGSATLNGAALADPQISNEGGRQRLTWVIGDLAPGQSASLRFATTVTAAAPTSGPIVNTAEASALMGSSLNPVRVNSNVATATVRLEAGVFSEKGTILGRVYFDKNNDNNYTAGVDEPLQGVRVYLSDGRYAVTDEQGRYSLSEVLPGLNTLRVDRLTVPYVPKAVPDDRGLRGTRQVRVEGGGLYTEDFLFENPASLAAVTRSTRVTVDGQRLEKTLTQLSSNTYTVTLTLTLNKGLNDLRILDPVPPGASRGALNAPGLQPVLQGDVLRLGNLGPGTYTLTYTLSGNISLERLLTDPDLTWEGVR